jgi:hypothetical protein
MGQLDKSGDIDVLQLGKLRSDGLDEIWVARSRKAGEGASHSLVVVDK